MYIYKRQTIKVTVVISAFAQWEKHQYAQIQSHRRKIIWRRNLLLSLEIMTLRLAVTSLRTTMN
jgi:hypothetical protein